jgi:hypothetical protein
MKTIETRALIDGDGRITLEAQAPSDIRPGEHDVLVIIDEKDAAPLRSPHLDFPVDSYGPWPEGLSLRREDLYGENAARD